MQQCLGKEDVWEQKQKWKGPKARKYSTFLYSPYSISKTPY